MYQKTLSLLTIFILLSGCGSSTSPKSKTSLNTLHTLSDNNSAIETSLRQAGFNAASNVVQLTDNKIAFTYYDNQGIKHFVVYDNQNGKILSNITHFKGEEVIPDSRKDTISFKNGTTVKTTDYQHPQVDYSQTDKRPTRQMNPKTLIQRQLPYNQHVTQFVYSPQKQGAAVLIEGDNGIVGLYLYGLDSSSPVREQNIYPLLEKGDNIYNIRFPKSGVITYMVTNMGWKYFYRYDYFAKKLTKYKTIDPHDRQLNEDNYSDNAYNSHQKTSPKEAIRAQIDTDRRKMRDFIYTSDNHSDAAVVIDYVGGDGAIGLVLYDIPKDGGAPYKVYDVEAPGYNAEWTKITNLKRIGGGKFTFTGTSRDANGYHTRNYTYYYLDHYYANYDDASSHSSYNDSDDEDRSYNHSMSTEESIRSQISQHLPGYELSSWDKTHAGQGFLAVARNGHSPVLVVFDNRDGRPVYEKYISLKYLDDPSDDIIMNPIEGGKVQIWIMDVYDGIQDGYEISYI